MSNQYQRMPTALTFPRNHDDIVFVHPKAYNLVYGDIAIVGNGEFALYTAGGEEYGFDEPGRYTIGVDARSMEDILLGDIGGDDLRGFPLQINTSLVFCRTKSKDYKLRYENYFMVNRMAGIQPEFTIRISVHNAVELIHNVDLENGKAIDQIMTELNSAVKKQLTECLYNDFTEYSSSADIRRQFSDHDYSTQLLERIRTALSTHTQKFGISIDRLDVISWNLQIGFCNECGAAVPLGREHCLNGHPVYRCPVCFELIYDGLCLSNGHDIMFCPVCDQYIIPKDNACPVHREIKRNA